MKLIEVKLHTFYILENGTTYITTHGLNNFVSISNMPFDGVFVNPLGTIVTLDFVQICKESKVSNTHQNATFFLCHSDKVMFIAYKFHV